MARRKTKRKPQGYKGEEAEVVRRPVRKSDMDISYVGFMVMLLGAMYLASGYKAVLYSLAIFAVVILFTWVIKMLQMEG